MPEAQSFLSPILAFGGFWVCLYLAWRYFRYARALTDTPTARIRSAPQGYVELSGLALNGPEGPVAAPLSGSPCVWYRFRVEKRAGDGKWKVVDRGASEAPFILRDDTGECVVYPKGADVMGSRSRRWTGDRPLRGAATTTGVLASVRAFSAWLDGIGLAGARYRYTEQRIGVGVQLHVLGLFRTIGGASELPDARRELADLLESWKRDERRMAVFDRNGDGRVDETEWSAAVTVATRQLDKATLNRPNSPELHTLVRPDTSDRPFLLAASSESRLVRGYQLRMAAATAGLLVSGGYLVWMVG
jgi:hypothetical protein